MKTPDKYIPKYYPDEVLYAIAWDKEDEDSTEWEHNFGKIFKVVIHSVTICKNSITYLVANEDTPSEVWGADVSDKDLDSNPYVLINKLLVRWKLNVKPMKV
jgi:hypothetical protein